MFSCRGHVQNFFQEGGTNFRHFSSVIFSTGLILSNLNNKNDSRGVRRLPREIVTNLQTAMAILVIFEQFLRKVCHIFLAPNFECFFKYDAFCSHSFDYACLSRLRHIVMKRFEIMENIIHPKHC